MIYVYALLAAGAELHDAVALEARPLELHAHGDIAAAISRHTSQNIEASVEHLLEHERVIESLMERHDLLPARFGTRLKDDPDLDLVLRRHHDSIVRGLQRVRGCVELGVRVMTMAQHAAPEPVTIGSSERPGHAYMLARAAEERRRKAVEAGVSESASRIHDPLARLARASVLRPLLTPELLLSAAYLIDRDGVEPFRSQVDTIAAGHPSLRILCTGPWPPYHFVPPLNPLEDGHG